MAKKRKCLCYCCEQRFQCYTNIKVFAEPMIQALFESYLGDKYFGETLPVEGAIKRVREDIKLLLSQKFDGDIDWNSNQSFFEQLKNKNLRR